jgi:hypothetical protein
MKHDADKCTDGVPMRFRKPKPRCPKCNCKMEKKGGHLECVCGFCCGVNARRCCVCGVILDEEH